MAVSPRCAHLYPGVLGEVGIKRPQKPASKEVRAYQLPVPPPRGSRY